MTRTLILMRHGKSAYPAGIPDYDRPLAPRGEREAALAGHWLRDTQPPVDAVRCSSAKRTTETLTATGVTAPVEFDTTIYGATEADLIELVGLAGDDITTMLVIGHAPGVPYTAWNLASNRDSDSAVQLSRKFPTSALAVLHIDGSWSTLAPGSAELADFQVPR